MRETDRTELLHRFSEDGEVVLLCVLGGSFAEGIDLPGSRLMNVVVISTGMPTMDAHIRAMQAYYQENNKLATPAGSTANISFSIKLADETDVIPVQYGTNSTFGSKPVVAYVKQGKEGE